MTPTKGDYLHGYLLNSGFGEEICSWHKVHPSVELHIFWDKKEVLPEVKVDSRLSFHQLMIHCLSVIWQERGRMPRLPGSSLFVKRCIWVSLF